MPHIYIAGHKGMVGNAIERQLRLDSKNHIITVDQRALDLTNQQAVHEFFAQQKIDQVYLAAAKVGGIYANNEYPAEFIYQNLMIQANVVNAAHQNGVQKLLFLGSSCIYPKQATQPMREDMLLAGQLEPTNEPYAIAKIAGIKLCESYNRQYHRDYRSVMPTNLYGENDNFHDTNSHVIPALMARIHRAKINKESSIKAWGSGEPLREFMHVRDLANAAIHVMNVPEQIYRSIVEPRVSHINIGSGQEFSIKDIAHKIAEIVGFKGEIKFDISKPDGMRRKALDNMKLQKLGFDEVISINDGLAITYDWYLNNYDNARG